MTQWEEKHLNLSDLTHLLLLAPLKPSLPPSVDSNSSDLISFF